jgi:hypothetical protein
MIDDDFGVRTAAAEEAVLYVGFIVGAILCSLFFGSRPEIVCGLVLRGY